MLDHEARRSRDRLIGEHATLLGRFDPERAIVIWDGVSDLQPYHHVPASLGEMWSAIERDFGPAGFEAFQKATMTLLMERFEARAEGRRYTPAIIECFRHSFARILAAFDNPAVDHYRTANDILFKDLALCRQKLFPGGARVFSPYASFARSLALRGGLGQALRVLALLARTGGNTPFYFMHVHVAELEDFNPKGYRLCLMRIAEMLELHPEIKGLAAGSWFLDPEMKRVSPHLAYCRQLPEENGAYFFFSKIDLEGGAFARSESRRALYKRGEYLPKSYALVWPRDAMIAWAKRARREHLSPKQTMDRVANGR